MRSEHVRDERGLWNYDDGPTTPEQTDADHAAQLSTPHEMRRDWPFGVIWPVVGPRDQNVSEWENDFERS